MLSKEEYPLASDPEMVLFHNQAVKEHSHQPLIVKLTPNVTDITENCYSSSRRRMPSL